MKHFVSAEAYLLGKTLHNPISGCLEWVGAVNNSGYASVHKTQWSRDYKISSAHQLAYILEYGDYDRSLNICHKCNNSKCCESTHLYAATQLENLKDKIANGTHPYGEIHGGSKLKTEDVLTIRRLLLTYLARDIANIYEVSESTISTIKSRKKWRHI